MAPFRLGGRKDSVAGAGYAAATSFESPPVIALDDRWGSKVSVFCAGAPSDPSTRSTQPNARIAQEAGCRYHPGKSIPAARCRGGPTGATLRLMRRWMIWALLAILWGLQGAFAAYRHAPRQAFLMLGIAAFFAYIGRIVHTREPGR